MTIVSFCFYQETIKIYAISNYISIYQTDYAIIICCNPYTICHSIIFSI